jgi:hypothetical protein
MTAAQLGFLIILALELITNTVKQLNIALIWVLAKRGDESVGHGARSLATDIGIGPELFR